MGAEADRGRDARARANDLGTPLPDLPGRGDGVLSRGRFEPLNGGTRPARMSAIGFVIPNLDNFWKYF